jgi:3-oxoacyl-[acyl-carrier protein] reductase
MASRFVDRVALVTGAGRGIGRAIAVRLGAEGAAVVVNDLDAGVAEDAIAEILGAGGQAISAAGSVAEDESCRAMVGAAEETFGGLDFLVNNAGLTADSWLHRMSDETWAITDDVMLRGSFRMCRAAARLLRRPKGEEPPYHRKVVNIASIAGIYGVAGNTNYSAAKAGVIGLSKALAREWASQKINVNVVAPGFVKGTRVTAPREDGDAFGIPPGTFEKIRASMPMGRGGTPEDVAGVVAFLCSTDSDFITGQVIEVHGGQEIIEVL